MKYFTESNFDNKRIIVIPSLANTILVPLNVFHIVLLNTQPLLPMFITPFFTLRISLIPYIYLMHIPYFSTNHLRFCFALKWGCVRFH